MTSIKISRMTKKYIIIDERITEKLIRKKMKVTKVDKSKMQERNN